MSASADSTHQNRPKRLLGPYEAFVTLGLLLVIILPTTIVGIFQIRIPVFPAWLTQQQGIACLFTGSNEFSNCFYIQVQSADYPAWTTVPETDYFQMPNFGYRTRLFRILIHANRGPRAAQALKEIATYVRRRHAELYPEKAPLDAVRFIRGSVSIHDLAKQQGHYYQPGLEETIPDSRKIYGESRWDDLPPTHPGMQPQWRWTTRPGRKTPSNLKNRDTGQEDVLD